MERLAIFSLNSSFSTKKGWLQYDSESFKNLTIKYLTVSIPRMKWLRIIILLIVMVSFLPMDTFADDHDSQHHCVLVCHSCHHVTTPDVQSSQSSDGQSSNFSSYYAFHYQDAILDQIFHPPISSL